MNTLIKGEVVKLQTEERILKKINEVETRLAREKAQKQAELREHSLRLAEVQEEKVRKEKEVSKEQ
jgi:hypothetical protein